MARAGQTPHPSCKVKIPHSIITASSGQAR